MANHSIIRLIQQFLRDQNLNSTLAALQKETNIYQNTVKDIDEFRKMIVDGSWDELFMVISELDIPNRKLVDLYQQVIVELVEMKLISAARVLLRQSEPMQLLREMDADRYLTLESMLIDGSTMQPDRIEIRKKIADSLCNEVSVVQDGRLLVLLGQALKWQVSKGFIQPDSAINLFLGDLQKIKEEDDSPPDNLYKTIKFSKKISCQASIFSADGRFLVTGTTDGFIEVWNHQTGKQCVDLVYQKEERFMLMETAILSLSFARDGIHLASGSKAGRIKVWNVNTGVCVRRFMTAHSEGVTSIAFNNDGSQLLSASFDSTLRLFGMSSGNIIKEYRGHSAWVNDACFSKDNNRIISGSSDGTIKVLFDLI